MSMFGIRDPRMRFGGPAQVSRETIPEGLPQSGVYGLPRFGGMEFGGGQGLMGNPNQPQIDPARRAPNQQAKPGMMGGGGFMGGSPSMGLFQSYMQNLFNQRYAPPVIPGAQGSIQQFGGFRGFGAPSMPIPQQQAPQQPMFDPRNPPGQNNFWDFQGGAPGM
jgi:hypothetical protein